MVKVPWMSYDAISVEQATYLFTLELCCKERFSRLNSVFLLEGGRLSICDIKIPFVTFEAVLMFCPVTIMEVFGIPFK